MILCVKKRRSGSVKELAYELKGHKWGLHNLSTGVWLDMGRWTSKVLRCLSMFLRVSLHEETVDEREADTGVALM